MPDPQSYLAIHIVDAVPPSGSDHMAWVRFRRRVLEILEDVAKKNLTSARAVEEVAIDLGYCPSCGSTGEIVKGNPHDPHARYEVCECRT